MNNNTSTRAEGRAGETVAANYLRSLGYTILCRNYRSQYGEVDIIALDGRVYAFVEVKMRSESEMQQHYGRPLRAVNSAKKQRIMQTAKQYIKEHSLYGKPARIDAMELYKAEHDGCVSFKINYIKHIRTDDRPYGSYDNYR